MFSNRAAEGKRERLENVAAQIATKLKSKDKDEFKRFTDILYARLAPEDVMSMTVDNLYGAALSAWKFIAKRKSDETLVQVYNPRVEEHGWKSSHTIIEVLNPDMPFLFDSVSGALSFAGHQIHVACHPVLQIVRNDDGAMQNLIADTGKDWGADEGAESFMHFQINEQTDPVKLQEIEDLVRAVLQDVVHAVSDWRAMLTRVDKATLELEESRPPVDGEELEEAVAFLEWLRDDHFTLLGCRDYSYTKRGKKEELTGIDESGLGILRDPGRRVVASPRSGELAPIVQHFLQRPELTLITKTGVRGRVHRQVHMDYIGIKRYDNKGKLIGERRFVGLFTSSTYNHRVRDIPILRRKVTVVMARAGMDPISHDGKALVHILETFPRDELFQISAAELHEIAVGILAIQERSVIRLFARKDPFNRYYSCLIYLPRERHNTALQRKFEQIMIETMDGRISNYYKQVTDSVLARMHVIVGINNPLDPPPVDFDLVEERLIDAARSWADHLRDALIDEIGEEGGNRLADRYLDAFPTAYTEAFNADLAIGDIRSLEELKADGDIALNFYRLIEDPEDQVRFKLSHRGGSVPLSDCLPMLENMGLRVLGETPYEVVFDDGTRVDIQDFHMVEATSQALDLTQLKDKLEAVFAKVWHGEIESDGFNRLVAKAGLHWREVVVLRALSKYLQQTAITYSQVYMQNTLAAHSGIARMLIDLFNARFDPSLVDKISKVEETRIRNEIDDLLEEVVSLDEDRIIRRFLNLIRVTLRTNYFQKSEAGEDKAHISFKLDSGAIEELPLPRPFREIFVYSSRVEGVHLRGGRVARGGLRWSDRPEDFRTEILGLMKAQMVKNAVIVPVGSKGGFVPKHLPAASDREAFLAEGIACYQIFINGLLDVTDNLVTGEVVPPVDVRRFDEDDPYLVVAADKGTATFSDIANAISVERGFWLSDAFASGGAQGYDHKKMGITAKGAWESVKRHFREMGRDIQNQEFSVIGIGDMSGDVFGNGMLLSKHIRLIAAFDHRDIFIDPEPNAAKSWAERDRLFNLPRSSWADYNKKLISKGGGIFSRAEKAIKLTPELKNIIGQDEDQMAPNALIHALLNAEADLLWFGGIGTYVKAQEESHADAGDRANDGIRIDGADLKFAVVGEGGNLGMTQLGRVGFTKNGGRGNTDAIDNSAGVDCSDHEVNIKILLGAVVADGEMTEKQRNRQLEVMTDEVGELVLRDNYLQSQALSVVESQGVALLESQSRFIRDLERAGNLDRAIEYLPDDEQIAERMADNNGLTRPELSVLLAYAKNVLYADLLETDLADSTAMQADLIKYFPRPLRKKFKAAILSHQLNREIVATVTANSMINRLGITFVQEMMDETGEGAGEIARAYVAAREAFGFKSLWGAIEDLDNRVPTSVQTEMTMKVMYLHRAATLWLLRNLDGPKSISKIMKQFADGIAELQNNLSTLLGDVDKKAHDNRLADYIERGVPKSLAQKIAPLEPLASACDIVAAANDSGRDVADVAKVYFALGGALGFDWLRNEAEALPAEDHWHRAAITAVINDLFAQQRGLTSSILAAGKGKAGDKLLQKWLKAKAGQIKRQQSQLEDLRGHGGLDISKLTLAEHQIARLSRDGAN